MKSNSLTTATKEILRQGLVLLDECDPKVYAQVAPQPFGASIGQHFRHVLDHFLCLASSIGNGTVNYDHRSRNRLIETSLEHARSHTEMLIWLFDTLTDRECSQAYTVECSVESRAEGSSVTVSTLGREIAYCISHAVHHFAIMKLICAHLNVVVAEDFGLAPSTLKYRGSQSIN